MNIYIYTKSGHNVGLEQLRRGAVLYKMLEKKECEPILCTSDYRAATFGRELGVYRGIGIDIIGNLPNLMERSDMLIFDSDEPSDTMREFMKSYCTKLFEVGVDIPKTLVDDKFFEKGDQSINKALFFSDNDYNNDLLKLCDNQNKQDIDLLMGYYFFLGDDEKLKPYFNNIIDEEEYFETILNTKYLLTSSINAAFESLAAGNNPVFYTKANNDDTNIIKEYNIPIVSGNNIGKIIENFETTIKNYPKTKILEKVNIDKIIDDISDVIKKFKLISPSLESNY